MNKFSIIKKDLNMSILVLGATGNVGLLVLEKLLSTWTGDKVYAIVRSRDRLRQELQENPRLNCIEEPILDMGDDPLTEILQQCSACIICLGHTLSIRGVWGPPYRLVRDAVKKVHKCNASIADTRKSPLKMVVLNTVGVSKPDGSEPRGFFEQAFIWTLSALVPPYADSIACVGYMFNTIGKDDKGTEWVIVRPDSFVDGDESAYKLSPHLETSLFAPQKTTKKNLADFMVRLAVDDELWEEWKLQMPVITNMDG